METKEQRQIRREEQCYRDTRAAILASNSLVDSSAVGDVVSQLMGDVSLSIQEWLEMPQAKRAGTTAALLTLSGAKPSELAWLALRVAISNVKRRQNFGSACSALGRYVEEHLAWVIATTDKDAKPYFKAVEKSLRKSTSEHHSRAVVRHVLRKQSMDLSWNEKMHFKVGAALLECLTSSTGHVVKRLVGKVARSHFVLELSPELLQALAESVDRQALHAPFMRPMIVEPLPWTNTTNGGFVALQRTIMKRYAEGQEEQMQWLPEVFAAVNKLQRTPWRINADLLKVLEQAWAAGSGVGKLPAQDPMPVPAQPWSPGEEPDQAALTQWKRDASKVHEANARLVSKRLAIMSCLQQARENLEEPNLYFVYTMDWRGRLYPCGSDLTPQGQDAAKALLEFSEGKPIGDGGFYWLAVQLANTYGHDKCSNDERVAWVLDNEDAIARSAVNPLADDATGLWLAADKPWQFLAACQEWTAARAVGESFVTHLPVAQDGSANGLQHFAALMRDQGSAEAVNLVPADRPADIYQRVGDRVQELLDNMLVKVEPEGPGAEWSARPVDANHEYWLEYAGDWRGLVKRPVMTVPYGVSMYGIRDQIVTEMVKRHGPDDWMPRATFLAEIVSQAIGDVVTAASVAMDWLKGAAKQAIAEDRCLAWTTPTGLPVVQDYRKYGSEQVAVYVGAQSKRVKVKLAVESGTLDKRKAVSGISPNFIHSLDAAHLVKTVNATEATSLGMVHDSYATLACDVGELGDALRWAFVDLHSVPLLHLFAQEQGMDTETLPPVGKFDLAQVLDAQYFFA